MGSCKQLVARWMITFQCFHNLHSKHSLNIGTNLLMTTYKIFVVYVKVDFYFISNKSSRFIYLSNRRIRLISQYDLNATSTSSHLKRIWSDLYRFDSAWGLRHSFTYGRNKDAKLVGNAKSMTMMLFWRVIPFGFFLKWSELHCWLRNLAICLFATI